MSKKYAIERAHLDRLRSGRKELFGYARTVKSADELREGRNELMASVQIYRTPKAGESVRLDIRGSTAHIPIVGQLTPSADPCGAWMGMSETEYGFIQASIIAAEDNDMVSAIALDVDSPGGYIAGLDETAQLIGAVTKPTVAYVGSMAASAAYWLVSQADKIVALSPASEIGSIGVAAEEYDDDEAMARDGVAHRVYTSTDAPDKRPDTKTEEGRAKIVAELDGLHSIFVRRVAEGRGVSEETVTKKFGKGGMLLAEKAAAVGMIDEVKGSHIVRTTDEQPAVGGVQAAGPKPKKEVSKMTQEEIDALKAQAYQDGINAERSRVAGLEAWAGINADVDKIIAETKANGKRYEDVASQLNAAAAKGKGAPSANGENAPPVVSGVAGNVSGVTGELDAIDHEAAAMFGYTAEDAKKFGKGAK